MLWVIFILTTTLFGYFEILLILQQTWSIGFHILSGWLFGSLSTSIVLYFTTYLFPLNQAHVITISLLQIIFSFFALKNTLKKKKQNHPMRYAIYLEKSTWLYPAASLLTLIVFFHLKTCFNHFPSYAPKSCLRHIEENSAIEASILYGINRKRSSLVSFRDPLFIEKTWNQPILFNLYSAALSALSASYSDRYIIIGLLNTLAALFFCHFALIPFTQCSVLAAFCFILHGNFQLSKVSAWRQPLGELLFTRQFISIPYTFLILSLSGESASRNNGFVLAAFLTSFVPNPFLSISLFIFLLSSPKRFKSTIFFLPFIILNLKNIKLAPIWTEYQMEGIYFAPIVALLEIVGFPLFLIFKRSKMTELQRRLSSFFLAILWMCFRDGNDSLNSSVCLNTLLLPLLFAHLLNLLTELEGRQNKEMKGVLQALRIVLVLVILALGYSGMNSLQDDKRSVFEAEDFEAARWVDELTLSQSIVASPALELNPAACISGRQVLLGGPKAIWLRGADLHQSELFASKPSMNEVIQAKKCSIALVPNRVNKTGINATLLKSNSKWGLYIC